MVNSLKSIDMISISYKMGNKEVDSDLFCDLILNLFSQDFVYLCKIITVEYPI